MPKVGKKHFKYTKTGYAEAKKHAEKTGKEVKYAMDGGMMNRKYYASGGAVYGAARKRKPTGRLTVGDIARSRKPTGRISARDLAFAKARMRKPTGRLSVEDIAKALGAALNPIYTAGKVVGKGAGTYIKARKRKPKGRLNIDDIKRALGKSKAQNKAMGGKIQAMRKKRKEKKARKPGPVAARRAALLGIAQLGLSAGRSSGSAAEKGLKQFKQDPGTLRDFRRLLEKDPSRTGHVGELRKMEEEYSQMMKDLWGRREAATASKKTTRKKVGPDWHKKGKKYAEGGKVKGGWRTPPKPGSKDWWNTPEGAKAFEKMQPKLPKPQKFPGKISKKQLKILQEARLEMSKRWSKHFPKVIGKLPIIGKPFKVLSKLKKKGKK